MLSSDNKIIVPQIYTKRTMDEYIHHPYWKVALSDGQIAYSQYDKSSWLQLKEWLKINPSIYIVGLWFGFRDHLEEIHTGQDDYFFTNCMLAEYGGGEQKFYIGGFFKDNRVHCKKYRIPEIYLVEQSVRDLNDRSVRIGLIKNEDNNSCESTNIAT